jgi:hypothetical protein
MQSSMKALFSLVEEFLSSAGHSLMHSFTHARIQAFIHSFRRSWIHWLSQAFRAAFIHRDLRRGGEAEVCRNGEKPGFREWRRNLKVATFQEWGGSVCLRKPRRRVLLNWSRPDAWRGRKELLIPISGYIPCPLSSYAVDGSTTSFNLTDHDHTARITQSSVSKHDRYRPTLLTKADLPHHLNSDSRWEISIIYRFQFGYLSDDWVLVHWLAGPIFGEFERISNKIPSGSHIERIGYQSSGQIGTHTPWCLTTVENSWVLRPKVNKENSASSSFFRLLIVWLLILRIRERANEILSDQRRGAPGRQVDKGLRACDFRLPSSPVLRVEGRIEICHDARGRIVS